MTSHNSIQFLNPIKYHSLIILSHYPLRLVISPQIAPSCIMSEAIQSPIPNNVPLGSLLIQNTMSTLLASNRVAFLQRDFGSTVAAQIVDRWAFAWLESVLCIVRRCGARGGDLVRFARHICCFLSSLGSVRCLRDGFCVASILMLGCKKKEKRG